MSSPEAHLVDQVIPHVTTVHVPAETLWLRAVERALVMLRGEGPACETPIEVSPLVRASTGPRTTRQWPLR